MPAAPAQDPPLALPAAGRFFHLLSQGWLGARALFLHLRAREQTRRLMAGMDEHILDDMGLRAAENRDAIRATTILRQ